MTAESNLVLDPATASASLAGELVLSGPSVKLDPVHLPVRGDLAHIRLAGQVFVPHYAVPMPHVVAAGGAALRKAGNAGGEVLAELAQGTPFELLDIAGGWGWGQVGADGLVGYVPVEALEETGQ